MAGASTSRFSATPPHCHITRHRVMSVNQASLEVLKPVQSARRARLLRLAANGVNAKRAAELIGVGHQTVLKEYQDPEFRRQVVRLVESAFEDVDSNFEQMQLSLHDRIRLKSEEAFQTLCELMDSKDTHEAVRMKIAQDILDRNPETQAGHTVTHNSIAEVEELRRAAVAAREMDKIVPIKKVV